MMSPSSIWTKTRCPTGPNEGLDQISQNLRPKPFLEDPFVSLVAFEVGLDVKAAFVRAHAGGDPGADAPARSLEASMVAHLDARREGIAVA